MENSLSPPWEAADTSLTRFPPNVEQLSVQISGLYVVLTVRRNDTEMPFHLEPGDAQHLANMLAKALSFFPAYEQ